MKPRGIVEAGWRRLGSEVATLRAMYRTHSRARGTCIGIFAVGGLLLAVSIGADLIRFATGANLTTAFALSRDGSIPELYGYVLSAVVVVLLGVAFTSSRLRSFLSVSALFAFILVDDAFRYHEVFGWALSRSLALPSAGGLRPEDIGELLAWLIGAMVLVPVLAWCLRVRQPEDAGVYLVYGTIMLCLGFFAVGLDLVHSVLGGSKEVAHAFGWMEDGGELVMLCFAAGCAILYREVVRSRVLAVMPESHSKA